MKQIIWIILIVISLILGLVIGVKLQTNNGNYEEVIQKNSKLFNERDEMVGCFSAEISSVEMCLLNCHDLSCYQKCHISNNDVLDKCYRNED